MRLGFGTFDDTATMIFGFHILEINIE